MFYVKSSEPKTLPLFSATTFLAVLKWCVKAEKAGKLHHNSYEIYSQAKATRRVTPQPELECTYEVDNA
jgi:hypothetical protein